MKQRSHAPVKIYYDDDVLSIRELEQRKVALQNSRYLAEAEADELRMLVQLFVDLEPYEVPKHRGPTLIRDDFFPEFVRMLVADITGHSWLDEWPYRCLDWECAIAQIQAESMEIEFNGQTYWVKVGEGRFGPKVS